MPRIKYRTINIDETDLKSIKKAERIKAKLENDGWTLIKTVPSLFRSKMIYQIKE